MCRKLCVLALLTLQAGLAHCFWDIVVATKNRLEFYKEGKVTYSVTYNNVYVDWITYDPVHNRVLLTNSSRSLISFDIATGKSQTLIDFKPIPDTQRFAYDPATGQVFATSYCKVYSYLIKPESNQEVDPHLGSYCGDIAVDTCGGYIYWTSDPQKIERVRLDGFGREEVIRSSDNKYIFSLTTDSQTQNLYWTEFEPHSTQYFIVSADLNGKHRRTLYHGQSYNPIGLTVSHDFIYWTEVYKRKDDKFFRKIPKNLPIGTHVEPTQIAFKNPSEETSTFITANYAVTEQTQGIPLCNALKRLLPNSSETKDRDSLNVSTGGSLLRVNETKVTGENRVSGDTWNVPVCQYYCLEGNCSVSADGQPKCRCNVGYSGVRCEVNACQAYCLHGGVCSLNKQNNPVCQCTGDYQGERCEVPDFLIKFSQAVSLLKDMLNADLTSVT